MLVMGYGLIIILTADIWCGHMVAVNKMENGQ